VGASNLKDWWLRRAGGSRRADTEFLYAVTKCVGMKVEDLCSAIRTLDFAASLVKCRDDVVSLNFVQGWQRCSGFGSDGMTLRVGSVAAFSGFCTRYRNEVRTQPEDGFR
jgi:hypothetical protein